MSPFVKDDIYDLIYGKFSSEEVGQKRSRSTEWSKWVNTVWNQVSGMRRPGGSKYMVEELVHYVTIEELKSGKVATSPDQKCVEEAFSQLTAIELTEEEVNDLLQSPDVTFGETLEKRPCRKCKKTNTLMFHLQARSVDEPTQTFFICLDTGCKFKWKEQ